MTSLTNRNVSNAPVAGGLFAIAAYSIWGLTPVYWTWLNSVAPLEVLAHRGLWSVPALFALAVALRELNVLRALDRRKIAILGITAILVFANWGIYIWAVQQGRILDASLGYYMLPLINVALGRLVLGERLSRAGKCAVALLCITVLWTTVASGQIPLVAMAIAGTFSVYGLIRKRLAVPPVSGLLVETTLLVPVMICLLVLIPDHSFNVFAGPNVAVDWLLAGTGLVTIVPLIFVIYAAKRLQYTTLGFFEYIAPTANFLLAVLVYDEAINTGRIITFVLIWCAVAIYATDSIRRISAAARTTSR